MPEPAPPPSALVERLDAAGIDQGQAVTAGDWLQALTDKALAWMGSEDLPLSTSLFGAVALRVFVLLVGTVAVVAAVRWWIGRRWPAQPDRVLESAVEPLPSDTPPADRLASALQDNDPEAILAASWALVEHALATAGRVPARPDRPPTVTLRELSRRSPQWPQLPTVTDLGQRYLVLRYGPADATPTSARTLATDARRFADQLQGTP